MKPESNARHTTRHSTAMAGAAHLVIGFVCRPCCSIPAAAALIGTGGTGAATVVAPWREWFLAGALAFFGVSFYWNFVRNRNPAGMTVWAVSFTIALGVWTAPWAISSDEASASNIRTEHQRFMNTNRTTTRITVTGMACNACAARLQRALAHLDGVRRASVEFPSETAVVEHHPATVSRNDLIQRIRKTGFQVLAAEIESPVAEDEG